MKETHLGSTGCTREGFTEDEQAPACAVQKWFNEMQRKEKEKKKKYKDDDDDDDNMYHPSQDYKDDSQVDLKFRPTKRELKEADKEGDSSVKDQVKVVKLYICKYVDQCTYV